MTDGPDLSIIIPSVNGWCDLAGCLEACTAQLGPGRVEVVVADRVGNSVRTRLRKRFPQVRLLEAPPGTTIPALRGMGVRAARGRVVGVIEDHIIVPEDWAERMLAAHRAGALVVGGAVDNAARETITDWAAFLCEYSHCLVPPSGPADWLVGNNVTYQRDVLQRFISVFDDERWENDLHDAMRRDGIVLVSHPEIRVGHKKHYRATEYLSQRYLYSRAFAGLRFAKASALRRAVFGIAALALPPVLFYRIVSRVWRSGRYRRELVRSLPLLLPFVLAWTSGEIVGSWFGPNDALSRVC